MLLRNLLNAGVLAGDAEILEETYANEPKFLEGLELIARAVTLQELPGLMPPAAEPWQSIHLKMLDLGDVEQGLDQAVAVLDIAVQAAVLGAIQARVRELQSWLQQMATQGRKRKTHDYVRALGNLGYAFAYNQCTFNIEVNGLPITDPVAAEIRNRMRDHGFFEVNIIEDAYLAEAYKNRYHPIKNYLTGLKYQGGNAIAELSNYFSDDQNVFQTWILRWLIGAVARVFQQEQNRMLVLDGYQGIGKDYFVRWLCSPLPEYFFEGPIMPDDKDHRLRLLSTWIWDANELGATTRRSDREALKAFLTTTTLRERKPYGHFDIQGAAICSFIGTVNNEGGILTDPTGHRRFMVSKLTAVDWNYTQVEIDQVWAQAMDLYLTGETWKLEGSEQSLAAEINESYQAIDIVEETIKQFFTIDPNDSSAWMSSLEILMDLKDPYRGNLKPGTEIDTRRLASALTKLGLEKATNKRIGNSVIRGYYGIKRKGP